MLKTVGRMAAAILTVAAFVAAAQALARAQAAPRQDKYPEPRFPSYLKQPKTADGMMPAARFWARAKLGFQGFGFGVVGKGEEIVVVTTANAEPLVVEAIRRALEERGVIVHILRDFDLAGVSQADAQALVKASRFYTSEKGYMEAVGWIRNAFAKPDVAIEWLKTRRPDLHAKLFPKEYALTPALLAIREKMRKNTANGIVAFLKQHPKVKGVFWGGGGSSFLRRDLSPYEDRYLGLFTVDNWWDLTSQLAATPSDVWQLAEEQTLEPLLFVDKLEITDPMGTNVSAPITQKQAEVWARGAYHRGHMFMYPHQASGRYGYSVIDYPAFQKDWLAPELVDLDGVVAATNGHLGFYPQMQVFLTKGYVTDVKGGGPYGEVFREFLSYPNVKTATYPHYKKPGFWNIWEIALGTQVKAFRNPLGLDNGTATPERQRSGVFHWGYGNLLTHEPAGKGDLVEWTKFKNSTGLPTEHGFHMHTYFTTFRVHMRNADRWLALVDRGRQTSLDQAEVRALASRYGDPRQLLTEDWIPEVPGINAPGRYEDFARDPWKAVKAEVDKVRAGTYEHFFPPIKGATAH